MVYDGLLLAALVMLFFVPFLAVPNTWQGGQTLGMKSWHLRLVETDGNPVSFKAANIRYVSAILSWALLGIGYLWILVDKDNLTLHDKLSGTRIVVLKKNSKAGQTKTKTCVA